MWCTDILYVEKDAVKGDYCSGKILHMGHPLSVHMILSVSWEAVCNIQIKTVYSQWDINKDLLSHQQI